MRTLNLLNNPAQAESYFETKLAFTTGPVELDRMLKSGDSDLAILDVRAPEDYEKGHIPGAVNFPQERWEMLGELQKDKFNVVYCYSQNCQLAAKAALVLARKGCRVMEMAGGFEAWKAQELEIEREPANRLRRVANAWLHWPG